MAFQVRRSHAAAGGRGRGDSLLSSFYFDLFDLGYEAVGELGPRQETLAEWEEPNRRGVVYCLDAERHRRGVLVGNIFGRVAEARDLISADQPIEARALTVTVG